MPTNISTNSEPEMEKNGTLASPATAFASMVLPVPGGPTSKIPFGMEAPISVYFIGMVEKIDNFRQVFLGFVFTGYIVEADALGGMDVDFRIALAHAEHHGIPAAAGFFQQLFRHILSNGDKQYKRQNGENHGTK